MATYEMRAIGHISNSRTAAEDDHWGSIESCITLTNDFGPEALAGIETFSHVEVLFLMDRLDPNQVVVGARHPRDNPAWPAVGVFAQRAKGRPNRIGATIASVVRVEDRQLTVRNLDAIDGTPVLDIKPVMREFLPRAPVRQPDWAGELMINYW